MGKILTKIEEEYIIENFHKFNKETIIENLKISLSSFYKIVNKNNLNKPKCLIENRVIDFIKNNFYKLTNEEISKELNISIYILNKIFKSLSLSRIKKVHILCYERNCPKCNKILTYTNSKNRQSAERKKIKCRDCSALEKSIKYSGKGNPFYGKKHSEEFKQQLSDNNKGKSFSPNTQFVKGQKALNTRPVFEIWKEKYDEETYNEKVKELKIKQSKASSGKNNPMYGKPSPNGSGNGWSGWYKGWFFRSLNELSYMVQIIKRFNLSWESGEQQKYKISYINWEGKQRNYFPDFIINEKYIVECKPKRLWQSTNVQSKASAAEAFCKAKGMKYKLVECSKLSFEKIKELHDSGDIKFTEKYEEKYFKLN